MSPAEFPTKFSQIFQKSTQIKAKQTSYDLLICNTNVLKFLKDV